MRCFFMILHASFQLTVKYRHLHENVREDKRVCAGDKPRLSCQIGSYYSLEVFKKKIHYFNRFRQPVSLSFPIRNNLVLENLDKYANKKVKIDINEHACTTTDASDKPLTTAFMYGDEQMTKTYSTGPFDGDKLHLGKPIFEVELFFHRLNETYHHFQYRARTECSDQAIQEGCSQKYTKTKALVVHYLTIENEAKFTETNAEGRYLNGPALSSFIADPSEVDSWMTQPDSIMNAIRSDYRNILQEGKLSFGERTHSQTRNLYEHWRTTKQHHSLYLTFVSQKFLPVNLYVSDIEVLIPNGCNKIDKQAIDDIKNDITRVRYCPLHAHQCVTNYPRHVFKRETKKGSRSRAEWQLGPGWAQDSSSGDDKMEMINDDYASKNLRDVEKSWNSKLCEETVYQTGRLPFKEDSGLEDQMNRRKIATVGDPQDYTKLTCMANHSRWPTSSYVDYGFNQIDQISILKAATKQSSYGDVCREHEQCLFDFDV